MVASAALPAGGQCKKGRRSVVCWKAEKKGFRYRDPEETPEGVQDLLLKEGRSGKSRIVLAARGELLPLPATPLAQPVTVQLRNGTGGCWQSVFSSPAKKNSGGAFRDRAD